ncbi:signaling recognition particle receptor family protein [Candidatus Neomarinimicrobiota bacterium]
MIAANDGITSGLTKTRRGLRSVLGGLWRKDRLTQEDFDAIEEALLMADVGIEATGALIDAIAAGKQHTYDARSDLAIRTIIELLERGIDFQTSLEKVIIIAGVNGTGKTTSAAKMAAHYAQAGKKSLLIAADTYRAAAVDQLAIWAERAGMTMVAPQTTVEAAALAYSGVEQGLAENYDRIIIDTAGRIHTSRPLMDQLAKLRRVVGKQTDEVSTLLVIDATVGQVGIAQARQFSEHVELEGYILSKMDGTARGGVAIPIMLKTKLPVHFTGVGEDLEDLAPFNLENYVRGLFLD